MSVHAFVDETKQNGFLLAAVVVAPRDLAPVRSLMRGLLLPGQSRLHFSKERPGRRGEIAAAISTEPINIDLYDASAIPTRQRPRDACLRQLVADLAAAGAQRLVLEQDDSLVRPDQAVLYTATAQAGASQILSYEHLPPRSEPLLWIADAAAWCWTHPGWRDRISPVVRTVHRL